MSQTHPPDEPEIPGDVLPPVEPPSAGFILQLFIVPGIIVAIIVMVWLLFNWVARAGNDPREDVQALKRNSANRWQSAVNLANALGNPGADGKALRQDAALATELSSMLEAEIEEGSTKEQPLLLRCFLCKALGEFEVPVGLAALVTAARTQRTPAEGEVRLAAIQAIAMLAENVGRAHPGETLATPEVQEVLDRASHDDDSRIRGTAAFAMGVVGGEESLVRLAVMLSDSNADVRYNAATRLAARGDARAIPVLADMLDPDESAAVDLEQNEELRPYKRALIVTNALRAVDQLLAANPGADYSEIRHQLKRLLSANPDNQVKAQATHLLEKLSPEAE
jgi:HEAT repeat protein